MSVKPADVPIRVAALTSLALSGVLVLIGCEPGVENRDGATTGATTGATGPAASPTTDPAAPADPVRGADLLGGHDWSHFAGATAGADGVRIRPLGRMIVKQDGTGGQPNPPVNLHGPRLEVGGDFELTAELRGTAHATAYLQLYGELPVVYDEWRQERRSVRLGVVDGRLEVAVFDGTKAAPAVTRTFGSGLPDDFTLVLARHGDVLSFRAGDTALGELPASGAFASSQVWFGADAALGGQGWRLAALRARPLDGGEVTVVDTARPTDRRAADPDSLRALAAARPRPLGVGTAVASAPLAADPAYRELVAGQFSVLTPENDLKPQFVQPQPGVFDFTGGDSLVEFADANGMRVHAHTLVFGEALPRWMRETPTERREEVMTSHVTGVAGHFKGRVAEWDVVNEPMSVQDEDYGPGRSGLRRHVWQQAMGEQYIDKAFRAARTADPDAKLYVNEFGLESDGPRWDAFLALVKRLKQRGVPLDGVGFQAHVHETDDHVDPAVLAGHFRALAELGLSVRISEIDVHGEDREAQAGQFALVAKVCAQTPSCTSYGTWGVTDRYGSTAAHDSYPIAPGDELMWDTRLKPKPAVAAVRGALTAAG
ncbi:endo-1,4-beta-xylanase [Kitasatospora sp. NPDC059803]|uniref:endo-1,4-beta-xylanase n=1 Tax=Kitasatospora sp. NPDC059803 TaxID=3346953 RepID=UPI003654ABCB